MTAPRHELIELWQRAHEALRATETLLAAGFPDFAAGRAYYAAFYTASALLLSDGKTFRSHRGVMALIHRDYVRPGHVPQDIGRITNGTMVSNRGAVHALAASRSPGTLITLTSGRNVPGWARSA